MQFNIDRRGALVDEGLRPEGLRYHLTNDVLVYATRRAEDRLADADPAIAIRLRERRCECVVNVGGAPRSVDAHIADVQEFGALFRIRLGAEYRAGVLKHCAAGRMDSLTFAERSIGLPTTPNCNVLAQRLPLKNAEIRNRCQSSDQVTIDGHSSHLSCGTLAVRAVVVPHR